MVSSSSSSIMVTPAAKACRYDVFLSFCGEDTRLGFTDQLYRSLDALGIVTFRDEEDINKGEELKLEIKEAIKVSEASIVVLSMAYATSTWCLEELVLILEQRRKGSHFVLPVFYYVEPTDVRNQRNTYLIKAIENSPKWTTQNVNRWKEALSEVAHLGGEVQSGSKYEADVINDIVDVIYHRVGRKEVPLPRNLIGITSLDEEIVSWLDGSNVEHLAICGMPGSGKTTLAKYLYNSMSKCFEHVSFIEDIGCTCKESNGLDNLKQQLLNDILGGKNRKIPRVSQRTCVIEEALQSKKALIVLDDIVKKEQLVALLGTQKINPQSKIIITTSVLATEKWLDSTSCKFRKYEMRLLNNDESVELLFCWAFKPESPKEGFKELAKKAVGYCEGNPLALELLGSTLSMNNSIKFWRSILTSLERGVHKNIQRVLFESYDTLPFEPNKKLFLHIACFFVGKYKDYVEQILDKDWYATSGITILCSRRLLSVSSNNKLIMHELLQNMGKEIVRQEAEDFPAKRSRVWLSNDSYEILRKGEGSETVEGLALDMEMFKEENPLEETLNFKTDSLQKMNRLKLLHLNSVSLDGSYKNISEHLRWLCWIGFQKTSIPIDLFVKNLVALDMSYSKLVLFDPPVVLRLLKILNLKDSHNLSEIRNMSRIPNLETLILWNCHKLVHVTDDIGNLKNLALLNMTGCEKLFNGEQTKFFRRLVPSTFRGGDVRPTFSFPDSLQRLFLKECNLNRTDSFLLSFTSQRQTLQYLNLCYGQFDSLPCYDHLLKLRVLDLSLCSKLKCLQGLPNTLAELYVYYCTSLERITFQSHQFTLLEFGYEGCISLSEIEGFIKLVPVTKLEENDLGHMKWLRNYEDQEVCLVGNDELTTGRSSCVQMLYEFDIISTSLLDIMDANIKHDHVSKLSFLSFDVPSCPKNRRLKGLDVTLKYTISSDDDWGWFCKINTTKGVNLMYNPIVFGKPDSGKVGIWLSYWPIGNTLNMGDKVDVSIIGMNGVEVHECGVRLVYSDDNVAEEVLKTNIGWRETLGGNLSGFKLSTGAYYLCRRDFLKLMEVGRLAPDRFRNLVGDFFDITEVRQWRKTGRPQHLNTSITELKTVRCIIHGPESEEVYKITQMSKSSFIDKTSEFTSSMFEKTMKSVTSSKSSDATIKELNEIQNVESVYMSKAYVPDEIQESTSSPHGEKLQSLLTHDIGDSLKKESSMGSDKEHGGLVTINMEKVRTILTLTYPYPHDIIAVVIGCLFFISLDNMHTLIQKLDNNVKWWSMYACLLGFLYFFSSPFVGKTIKPSYSNFSRWYIAWILVAAVYHLPSFQSMGVDMRMNLSLFLTIYIASIFVLLVFHLIFLGLWYVGLVSRLAGRRPEILTIVQNCAVISVACCVFYSHCGNHALNEKRLGRRDSGFLSLWKKGEPSIWLSKFLKMYELKDEVCKSWFAPVGSAGDYPLLSKWVIYGEFSCSGPCESSEEISPIYSLWATFIGLYMANYVVERSTGWALTHPLSVEQTEKIKNKQMKPNFLDMVPWYSGISADLFKTVFDLLVSVTVFVGRFDMRMMQAAMSRVHEGAKEDFLYDHFNEKDHLWFDFMADTGDGGNSSYSVARLLAQPSLYAINDDSLQSLPRGDLLLIGGDLAYPNPSAFTYEERFFRPFEYALQPPSWYTDEHIAVDKPELPVGVSKLKDYDGPQCFVIPGNHDWFDGLQTFRRYICHKSWLGGWLMPQKKSYFALHLPKGWWVFGLDLALHCDIDVYQFKFFAELIKEKVKETDSVIIMTHEPNWILDWYWDDVTGKNVSDLVKDHLKGRCRLRMAGDLHHYMRHLRVPSETNDSVQHLLVNGCGGAFLHPTHVFSNFDKAYGATYEMKSVYPSVEDSSRIALGNILKFRKKNWQFDFIGGFIYFILTFSMFPQCNLGHILHKDGTFSGHVKNFFTTVWDAFMYMLGQSYVSSTGALLLLVAAISFVPSKVSRKRRAVIGVLHVSAHLSAALILMLLMELGVELCVQHKLLATSGYHTLYEWYRSVESEHFPDPTGLRVRIEQWTFGLYPACIKYFMSAFDVPEVMAVTRTNICKNGLNSLSLGGATIYYASVFLYFWVFSTPVVSLVFGSYLYICINWLQLHFDEAFSSLRIANYKSFTRFHIKEDGDLEIFTLAVDKVPKDWKLDPEWDNEVKQPQLDSHNRMFPSKWQANAFHQDPINTVKIVDHFVIQPTDKVQAVAVHGNVSH